MDQRTFFREEVVMFQVTIGRSGTTPDYAAVSDIVSRSGSNGAVSVRRTIRTFRSARPSSRLSDEDLTGLIVQAAIGRTSAVHFDGKLAEPTLPLG